MVNLALGRVGNDFLIVALFAYSLAVLAFAGDFAFGRPVRRATAAKGSTARVLATVGAGGSDAAGGAVPPAAADSMPAVPLPLWQDIRQAGKWVRAGLAFSALAVSAHMTAVIIRAFAVHRAPWGNMYEFITALTCFAAIFFLGIVIRFRAWALGLPVLGAVLVALGIAETTIYTQAETLVPALKSYWLSIHVTALTIATGVFFVAAVLGILYLVADRYQRRVAAGKIPGGSPFMERIPSLAQLDRLVYRTIVFGFPVWTFGVIAGAIWADQAWGRYWGWDPVETWAFITWVVYAAFLHARATAGWRGRRAQYIQLLGFATLVFNMLIVQTFITGLHSYAGVG
jgi:cytochrome c-type biogenesis protein CcsB